MQFSLDNEQGLHSYEHYSIIEFVGDLGGIIELVIVTFSIPASIFAEHSFIIKALQKFYVAKSDEKKFFKKDNKKSLKKKLSRGISAIINSQRNIDEAKYEHIKLNILSSIKLLLIPNCFKKHNKRIHKLYEIGQNKL